MLTPADPPLDLGGRHRGVRALAMLIGVALVLLAVASVGPSPTGTTPDAPAWAWLGEPPSKLTALGPIALDSDLAPVVDRLGPSQPQELQLGGTGHSWTLEGGASLLVVVDDVSTVTAVELRVPRGSPVRGALQGGIEIGRSSVDEVVRAWGPPDATGGALDDFALRYVTCIGPAPIVIKFDSQDRSAGGGARIDSGLVAYADEAPGTSGCRWTSDSELAALGP